MSVDVDTGLNKFVLHVRNDKRNRVQEKLVRKDEIETACRPSLGRKIWGRCMKSY